MGGLLAFYGFFQSLISTRDELDSVQTRGAELLHVSLDAKSKYSRKLKKLKGRKDALLELEQSLRRQQSDMSSAQRVLADDVARVNGIEAGVRQRERDLEERMRTLTDRESVRWSLCALVATLGSLPVADWHGPSLCGGCMRAAQVLRDRELAVERERLALLSEGSAVHHQASDFVSRSSALSDRERVSCAGIHRWRPVALSTSPIPWHVTVWTAFVAHCQVPVGVSLSAVRVQRVSDLERELASRSEALLSRERSLELSVQELSQRQRHVEARESELMRAEQVRACVHVCACVCVCAYMRVHGNSRCSHHHLLPYLCTCCHRIDDAELNTRQ